jgi:hypothetical protein
MDLLQRLEAVHHPAFTDELDLDILRVLIDRPDAERPAPELSTDLQMVSTFVPPGTKAAITINPDGRSSAQLVFEIAYEFAPYGRLTVAAPGNERPSEACTAALALCAAIVRYKLAKARMREEPESDIR